VIARAVVLLRSRSDDGYRRRGVRVRVIATVRGIVRLVLNKMCPSVVGSGPVSALTCRGSTRHFGQAVPGTVPLVSLRCLL
jgi:hypothetical protein